MYFFDTGYTTLPALLTSAVHSGDTRQMGVFNWDNNEYCLDSDPEEAVIYSQFF